MGQKGFSLIELMLVLVIVALLAGVATPVVTGSVLRAKEAALKKDLHTMRETIDDYYTNTGKYPDTLDVLVTERYLRDIPVDPFTDRREWTLVYDEDKGIIDIHSTFDGLAKNGEKYGDW